MTEKTNASPSQSVLVKGAKALTDAQLLSIVLGCSGKTAQKILDSYGSLYGLWEAKPVLFRNQQKAQHASYAQALEELNRRRNPLLVNRDLWIYEGTSPFRPSKITVQPNEAFINLFFDTEQHLMSIAEVLYNSMDKPLVYESQQLINDAVKQTLQHKAAFAIFMHNIPDFDGCPMPIDLALSWWLFDALTEISVELLDYLVMGNGLSISFAEKRSMKLQ